MNTTEKELAVGRIATTGLGSIAREIASAIKKRSRKASEEVIEKSSTKILESVLAILKKTQKDIRATMDGETIDEETGETIESGVVITETIDHDGRC